MPAKATIIRHTRVSYSGISAEQMLTIGTRLLGSIKRRITSAKNAEDQPAKPLKVSVGSRSKGGVVYHGGYPASKARRGIAPLRNWLWTGGTLAQMVVKEVSQNRGVIGFANSRADQIAHFNNLREKAFGVSPTDKEVLRSAARIELSIARGARDSGESALMAAISDQGVTYSGAGSFTVPSRRSAVSFPWSKSKK